MNYGKYFRLNLKESKVVDGVSVYDYIDLPAYFGPSKSMSPKYPISVVISRDSIRFRLHYCAYKYELDDAKEIMYKYDPFEKLSEAIEDDIRTIHMQEVILELPIYNINEDSLANNIRKIYCSRFPQLTEDDANLFKEGFLNQLLKKRYGHDYDLDLYDSPLEQDSYRSLRANNDSDRSYSTIWLMDLQKNDGQTKYIELDSNRISIQKPKSILSLFARKTNTQNSKLLLDDGSYLTWEGEAALEVGTPVSLTVKEKLVPFDNGRNEILRAADILIDIEDGKVKRLERIPRYESFLRKLLLDFMFDLAHSDVFQNSPNYTETYSGLMSDAMFSSLMHKCEYYYYRGLTIDALEEIEIGEESRKSGVEERIKQIKMLYATHLFEAEKKWVEDIMNPYADTVFQEPQDDFAEDWKSHELKNTNYSNFRIFPYWFASPEEEMRRICFSLKSHNPNKTHLCNAETLAHYLDVQNTSAINRLRTRISKWFVKRYDFDDAWRLHLHKGYAKAEFLFLLITIGLFIGEPQLVEQVFWEGSIGKPIAITLGSIIGLFTLVSGAFAFIWPLLRKKYKRKVVDDSRRKDNRSILWSGRVTLAWRRVFELSFIISISIGLILLGAADLNPSWKWIGLLLWAVFFIIFVKQTNAISNIHLLYPRLFASITAAWLSLAIGNELFSAFFDSAPSILACVSLATIVLVFIIYEINRHFPLISTGAKVWRSVQMLVYSYAISLLIGLFIINFTGREFLERSEYLPVFFEEYEEAMNPQSERVPLNGTLTNDTASIVFDNASDTLRFAAMDRAQSVILTEGHSDTLRIAVTAKAHTVDSTKHPHPRHHPQAVNQRHGYFRPKGVIPPPENSNRHYFEQLENRKVPGKDHYISSIWRGVDGDPIFFILRDFLIQFAFLAMFIGVFIQMIFEEKSITEM